MREDRFTTTEHDAGRYEALRGDDYDPTIPTRSEANRDAAGDTPVRGPQEPCDDAWHAGCPECRDRRCDQCTRLFDTCGVCGDQHCTVLAFGCMPRDCAAEEWDAIRDDEMREAMKEGAL